MKPKLANLEKILLDALKAASDHLDYCGYGDKWERECAQASRLRERIEAAITHAEKEDKP